MMDTNVYYQPTGLNDRFNVPGYMDFQDYIAKTRQIIAAVHADEGPKKQADSLMMHSPAEFIPSQTSEKSIGILLIHGLLYSPYQMDSLFQAFKKENFHVRTLLLPGQGSVPGDLLHVARKDWIEAVHFAIQTFRPQVKKLIVVGMSVGGALALEQAYQKAPIDALILFAPALKLSSPLAPLSLIAPCLDKIGGRLRWFNYLPETDPARYQSMPFNAIAQVYLLGKSIRRMACRKKLKIPQFIVASAEDETVDTRYLQYYFSTTSQPSNRFILYSRESLHFSDNRIENRTSVYPGKRILDFSHVCLPISATHPHFGAENKVLDFSHYQTCLNRWFQQSTHVPPYFGAVNNATLRKYRLARLSYNPDFEQLYEKMLSFILSI